MLVVADTIWQERKFLLNVSIEAWTGSICISNSWLETKGTFAIIPSNNVFKNPARWVRDNAKCPRRQTRDGAHGKLQGS